MKTKTQTALLILLIAVILSVVGAIFSFMAFSSMRVSTFTPATPFSFSILLGSSIAMISSLMVLIGAILFYIGRKEFGDKHEKYVKYALCAFIGSVIIGIISAVTMAAVIFSYVTSDMTGQAVSGDVSNVFGFIIPIFFSLIIISAVIGNLTWVFGLYQLQNGIGRKLLLAYYVATVVISVLIAWNTYSIFSDLFSSLPGTTPNTSFLSNYMWMGTTGMISLAGNFLTSLLLLGAIYIPYKRISSGELQPVITETPLTATAQRNDRICPNCGRGIPFDANVCPYCSKQFTNY